MCSAFTLIVGMTIALLFSLGTCVVQIQSVLENFACTKRPSNLTAEAIINNRNARLCARCAIFLLKIKEIPFSCRLAKGFTYLKEVQNQFKILFLMSVVLANFVPTERCESLGGYVTTPRIHLWLWNVWSLVVCSQCSFYVTRARKDHKNGQKSFFFAKKRNLLPNKQLFPKLPFQSTKYRKKDLCVEKKVQEAIGGVYCPTCRNGKCVYISTNKTTSFYDCKRCKACCHVSNNPFKDQKPTVMLFGGDAPHCFARKTCRNYEKEKPSPLSKKFLRQSDPSTCKPEPKKAKVIPFKA